MIREIIEMLIDYRDDLQDKLDIELAKDYRKVVSDCADELLLSCKENREFNNNNQIKSEFDRW